MATPYSSTPAAGWYPDPEVPGYVRYWDGASWAPESSRPSAEFEQAQAHAHAQMQVQDPAQAAAAQAAHAHAQAQGRVIQGEVIAAQSVPLHQLPAEEAAPPQTVPSQPGPAQGVPAQGVPAQGGPPRSAQAAATPQSAAWAGAPASAAEASAAAGATFIPPRDELFAVRRRDPAPLARRLLARVVDLLVPLGVGAAVAFATVPSALDHLRDKVDKVRYEGRTETVWLLDGTTAVAAACVLGAVLAAMFLYEALPTWRWGRSVGKAVFGLRVVGMDSHDSPGLGQVVRRWLVFSLPTALGIGLIGILRGAFDRPWHQGWHDRAAGTFVGVDGGSGGSAGAARGGRRGKGGRRR